MQSYIGETHPAHHSLVLSSQISALPLNSDTARHKFRVLAGPHWDAKDDSFKLSVNRFTTREENAKWASQTLDRLLSAANVRCCSFSFSK